MRKEWRGIASSSIETNLRDKKFKIKTNDSKDFSESDTSKQPILDLPFFMDSRKLFT